MCYNLTLSKCLSIFSVVMILVHKVHIDASSMPKKLNWTSAISCFLEDHQDLVQDKVHALTPQVMVIVEEIQNRNFITKLKITSAWKFSEEEAEVFAEKLNKCVEDNLI